MRIGVYIVAYGSWNEKKAGDENGLLKLIFRNKNFVASLRNF